VLGVVAVLITVALAVALPPRTGMGSLHGTPEAALVDALGPDGWLGSSSEVEILQVLATAEGRVVLYVDDHGSVGVADAKRRYGRWYAHGMFGLWRVHGVTCWQAPISSTAITTAAGPQTSRAESVIAIDDNGNRVVAHLSNGIWAVSMEGGKFRSAVLLDAGGSVITEELIADCG
jgi:hypothetical protein